MKPYALVRRGAAWLAIGAIVLVSGSCRLGESKPLVSAIVLQVTGTIASSTTRTPIANATVELGMGGSVSLPTAIRSTSADLQGRYALSESVTVQAEYCPELWIRASAPGFRTSSRTERLLAVRCTAAAQLIDVVLVPNSP